MNRWVRLGLQTAFGLALLWLWLRTVSLPEVVAHARVQNWWAVALMIVLFLVTSVIRARRWLLLLRPLAPVGMVRAFAMNAAGLRAGHPGAEGGVAGGTGRTGVCVSRRQARAVDTRAGGSPRRAHGAGAGDRRVHFHAPLHRGRHLRADAEGDGRLPGAAPEL